MISRSWLALFVGTLVFAVSMWFALVAIAQSEVVGVLILAVGLVLTAYAVAGFSEAEMPFDAGFRAAMYALLVGGAMLAIAEGTGSEQFLILAPFVGIVVGVSQALAPVGETTRFVARIVALIPVCLVVWLIFWVDPVVYGVVAPLIPLVAVGLADRTFERAREVLAEKPPGA